MELGRTETRRIANAVQSLLVLGLMQTVIIAVYLFTARGRPEPLEGVVLTVCTVYPFVCAGLTKRLALRLIEPATMALALSCTTAIVTVTGGLLSPFLPVFVTIPSASFSASGAAGVARLGVGALLGVAVVAAIDLGGALPTYGIDPEMLPRARIMLLVHSLAVMIIVGLGLETARRRSVRRLARAKESAEAGSRAKSDFLAMISHELRTPLAGLVGALSLALDETQEDETRKRLGLAASCAESLRALLDEILDFSRVEAGRMTMRPEAVAPRTIVRAVTSLFSPAAAAKGIDLRTQLGVGMELGVLVDALRMRQVLANLVGNALKFTERGSVTVTGSVEQSGPERLLRMEVRDTGVGMNSEQLARLFEPFVQVHERGGGGGTGLGLVSSRSLITQMGGTLELRSEQGVGTSAHIEVRLPAVDAPEASEAPPEAEPERPGPALRVLVAEDTPALRQVIGSLLRREGCTTVFATNGVEAVRAFDTGSFDLVLMDVHMPELDGLAATRQIRARESTSDTQVPIYGLSAGAFAAHEREAIEAGMTGYLVKPMPAKDLRALLAKVRSGAESTLSGP